MIRTIGGLIGLAVLGGLFVRDVVSGGQAQAIQAVFAVSAAVSGRAVHLRIAAERS